MPPQKRLSWSEQYQKIVHLTQWSARGKIAIQQGKQASIYYFTLHQQGYHYRLKLSDTLGIRHVIITGGPHIAQLWNSPDHAIKASSAEALLAQQTHLHLPISQLLFWIRGIPAPGPVQQTIIRHHTLKRLQQNGWHIRYIDEQYVHPFYLPKHIHFQYGTLHATLFIQYWGNMVDKHKHGGC